MKFEHLKQRLLALDTAAICDADKNIRVISSNLRPLFPSLKMVGIAHTIKCHEDFLTVIKALSESRQDEVLVIDSQNSRSALAGELFATEASRRGLAGIVIDGAFRDTGKVKDIRLPIYSKTIHPLSGTANKIFETQVSITCGDVTINPGDILFGDEDGIVVLTNTEAEELIPLAEDIQKRESSALIQMQQGKDLIGLTNFKEHWQAISKGQSSKLKLG